MILAKGRVLEISALAVAVGLTLAACSSGGGGDTVADDGIVISGSSTVEPISSLNAEKFHEREGVAVSVDGPGTGDGFARFCAGETDISDASRPIEDAEKAECEAHGIDYTELEIGIDGLSVVTSPENTDVSCVSFGDLYALLGPESEGFEEWSDADALAEELGNLYGASQQPFPQTDLVVTAPGEESGTYDSFVEIVIEEIAEARGQEAVTRRDYTSSPNDNVIIEGVRGAPGSLGWVGFAFVTENSDELEALAVDGGEGCVVPSDATVGDGTYPISRRLYIYVNNRRAQENPAVADFVDFYLSDDGLASVEEVGYVRLPDADVAATRKAWQDARAA